MFGADVTLSCVFDSIAGNLRGGCSSTKFSRYDFISTDSPIEELFDILREFDR